jgi:short-subunit dehydrogenase
VGSAIAELKPDPKAASYAASKSGLHGFVSSLQDELKESAMKIGLFSPGYMDTEMLPSTASVRRNGARINAPLLAAEDLLRWIKEGNSWHRIFDGE